MQSPDAFAIDERYDRVHASDRKSRYGAYLAQRTFCGVNDEPIHEPAEFAARALEVALPPVMSPPYVITHRRILFVGWHGDDDGRVAAVVDFATSLPPNVMRVVGSNWRSWSTGGCSGRYHAPEDNDRPLALCRITLRIPLNARRLPEPKYHADGTPKVATAKEATQLAILQLNGVLREFLAATSTTRSAA